MRVVINGLAALKPKTGVGYFATELIVALQNRYPLDEFTLYPGERLAALARRFQKTRQEAPTVGAPQSSGMARLRTRVTTVAKSAGKSAASLHFLAYTRYFPFDLYHEPNYLAMRSHLPTIVSVHDLSVLKYPQWHPADRVRHHHHHFLRGLNRALHVIVGSEATRRELIDELGCRPERVSTVYYGIREEFRPQSLEAIQTARQRLDLPTDYFLCVGTIEPRKNLVTVIRAFADLPPEVRVRCPLVLAGPWGWQADREREAYETIGQPAGVRYLGYTPAELLPAVYAGARALLFPSHYEGFGMPPTEMLACGGAVLSSTADTLREVLAGHAEFIPTEDVSAWRAAMQRIATDDEALAQLKVGGREFAGRYNWRNTAEKTMAVYRRVLGYAEAAPPSSPSTPGSPGSPGSPGRAAAATA